MPYREHGWRQWPEDWDKRKRYSRDSTGMSPPLNSLLKNPEVVTEHPVTSLLHTCFLADAETTNSHE